MPGRLPEFDSSGSLFGCSLGEPLKATKGEQQMNYESLSHTRRECKYHVVFIPKYRRKALYGELRRHLGKVFQELARQKECKVEEGHLMPDHVHRLLSIPPKHSVSQVMGFLKGKSAIHIARAFGGRRRDFVGQHFWARGG
jgi:putative transposase